MPRRTLLSFRLRPRRLQIFHMLLLHMLFAAVFCSVWVVRVEVGEWIPEVSGAVVALCGVVSLKDPE